MSSEHENLQRVIYGDGGPIFLPVCPKCGRFVKADEEYAFSFEARIDENKENADCKKCGRVAMPFEGWEDE